MNSKFTPSRMLQKARTSPSNRAGMAIAPIQEDSRNFFARMKVRTAFVHLGLVVTCIGYILLGAYMFESIERPRELQTRKEAVAEFRKLQAEFLSNVTEDATQAEHHLDRYMEALFLLLGDPIYAHVFESHFTNYSTPKDRWTFSSAVLFTTTTVIPVGQLFNRK